VVGVYGLSLITVAATCALGPLVTSGSRRSRITAAIMGVGTLATVFVYGTVVLSGAVVQTTGVRVRIVQANVAQESKWTPEAYRGIVDRYLALTSQPAQRMPDVVIWPEGALPASFNTVFSPLSPDGPAIAAAIQPGQTLLAGLARGEVDPRGGPDRYYNSLFALADDGVAGLRVAAVYDKHRLVPFGEYLPLGGLMTRLGVRSLVHMPSDFTAGPRPAPILVPGLPAVQPLICYESLYPGFTRAGADRPQWIVNVSNDAWFGATSGPLQHLNLASYRAIETGLPVVRATPTGVSAIIDGWGRIVGDQRLESGVEGILDADLPAPARMTVYGRIGDSGFWMLIGLMLAAVLGLNAKAKSDSRKR